MLVPRLEKLFLFKNYHKVALVVVPSELEHKKRIEKKERYLIKNKLLFPPVSAESLRFMTSIFLFTIIDHKENFIFPGKEEFDEIHYLELDESEAKACIALACSIAEIQKNEQELADNFTQNAAPSVSTVVPSSINSQSPLLSLGNPAPLIHNGRGIPIQGPLIVNQNQFVNSPNGSMTPLSSINSDFTYSSMVSMQPALRPSIAITNPPTAMPMPLNPVPLAGPFQYNSLTHQSPVNIVYL